MACCAPWWTVVCVSVVEDVWEKRWEKVVGVKRSCNTAVYLEGTGGRDGCVYWETDGLARVSVSEVERGEEEGKKTTRQLYLCLLGHWAHGSATDRSKNGLGKSVDDITLHLSTPTDCQIDKNVEPLLRALHKKHSISWSSRAIRVYRDDAVRALERRVFARDVGVLSTGLLKVHVTCNVSEVGRHEVK